jgi:hypothetical protein
MRLEYPIINVCTVKTLYCCRFETQTFKSHLNLRILGPPPLSVFRRYFQTAHDCPLFKMLLPHLS